MSDVHNVLHMDGYSEGYVRSMGYWLFYRSFGDNGKKGTVVCLHGGPGATHDSLLPFAKLSEHGYRVVFYDQLGCGKSQQPQDPSLYTVERYVEELEGLRKALDIGKMDLWGVSWGGFLNLAYAVKYSQNLRSLMPSSGSPSTPLCLQEMWRLRSELPFPIKETLAKYEERGDFYNEEYLLAMDQVYHRHLCRLDPWPPQIRSLVERRRSGWPGMVYKLMWGPNEFTATGTIRYWDVTTDLPKIQVPTLITCGRFDEVTAKNSEAIQDGISGSKMVIFENSSHSAILEEPELYLEVHRKFLDGLV